MLPNIIETIGRNTKIIDIPTKLLQDRIIYLYEDINNDSANAIIMQLLWLNSDKADEPIDFYINSPGGCIYDTFAIKDTIYKIKPKVNTIGLGICASGASFLLAAGTGVRSVTKNCRIMIHSVGNRIEGRYHDIEVDYKELEYQQKKLIENMSEFSKTSFEKLMKLTERDCYLSPEEAQTMGLIDNII